jgi:hypothetical protein
VGWALIRLRFKLIFERSRVVQRFPCLVAAAGAALVLFAACGGKVVVESPGATGGGGGAGGAGDGSTGSMVFDGPFSAVAVGPTSAGQVGSSGVTVGSGPSCVSCAQAASQLAVNANDICPEAAPLYNDLFACACAGACATQCSATACIGQATPDVCSNCLGDPGQGCGLELKKCLAGN